MDSVSQGLVLAEISDKTESDRTSIWTEAEGDGDDVKETEADLSLDLGYLDDEYSKIFKIEYFFGKFIIKNFFLKI